MSHEIPTPPGLEFNQLLSRRGEMSDAYGSFSKRQIRAGKRLTRPFVQNTPKDIAANQLTIGDLAEIRKSYAEQGIGRVSTPRLTASFIANNVEKFVQDLALSHPSMLAFCTYVDFATGVFEVTDRLLLTEEAIRGTLTGKVDEVIADQPVTAEARLAIVQDLAQYEELLKKDPTGKRVAHAIVTRLKKEPGLNFVTRDIAMDGALFAQRTYEAVYPIAERVNKATA